MESNNLNYTDQNFDFWFKVVGYLQQNWVIIKPDSKDAKCVKVLFIDDNSRIFDMLQFSDLSNAEIGLIINGFAKYSEAEELSLQVLRPPSPPFDESGLPKLNGIYSSGKFWKQDSEENRKHAKFLSDYKKRKKSEDAVKADKLSFAKTLFDFNFGLCACGVGKLVVDEHSSGRWFFACSLFPKCWLTKPMEDEEISSITDLWLKNKAKDD